MLGESDGTTEGEGGSVKEARLLGDQVVAQPGTHGSIEPVASQYPPSHAAIGLVSGRSGGGGGGDCGRLAGDRTGSRPGRRAKTGPPVAEGLSGYWCCRRAGMLWLGQHEAHDDLAV